MASTIKIKRSETAGNPTTLGAGELAYSALPDNGANGGDRLYIGIGTEIEGNAVNHVVIGGKHFTDMLDHTPGVNTPSSALITDSLGKIDKLTIKDILIELNTITATGDNQNLLLAGSGTGKVKISNAYTLPKIDGTSGYVLTTDGAGNSSWQQAASSLLISTDNGGDTLDLLVDSLNFEGSAGVTTSFNQNTNTLTISNRDTAPGVKGVAAFTSEDFDITSGLVALKPAAVRSIVSTLVGSGSSQAGITVSYNTNTSKLDFSVPTNNVALTGDVTGTGVIQNDRSVSIETVIADSSIINSKLEHYSLTIGTTSIALGATTTSLSGLVQAGIGSFNISDNTLSISEANANLNLRANGTGVINAGNFVISGVGTPVASSDAANKLYVDSAIQGIKWKDPVNLLAETNVALTGTTGTLVIDQHTALTSSNVGYRILLKNQTNSLENGIYVYSDNGSTYTLNRSQDAGQISDLINASVFVTEGVKYKATGWVQANHYAVTYSDQSWVQFSAASNYTSGNGISISGTEISLSIVNNGGLVFDGSSVKVNPTIAGSGLTYTSGVLNLVGTADRISVNTDSVDIAATYAGQTSISTLGTITAGTWQADTLAAAYGGTGITSVTVGDLLVGSSNNTYTKLTLGSAGKLLQSDGSTLVYSDLDGGTY